MQVTLNYCDFSTQVAQHRAHFGIVARGETDDLKDSLRLDACVSHVDRMVKTLLTEKDTPAREVTVKRLVGVELPTTTTPDGSIVCELCPDHKPFASQGSLGAHRRREHGLRVRARRAA